MASYRFSQGKLLYKKYQACSSVPESSYRHTLWSDSIEEHNNYGRFGLFVLVLFAEPDLSIGSVATQRTSPSKLDSC